ncbi:MAG: AmmeMemoRadiSam system protein A, partial [Spirochaetales bacterium]|nr:AmmeMemoRadiSam system protein A [Spirochaetales bacterium]
EKLEACLKNSDFLSLITFDDKLLEEAGECGHRSFSIMAGLFEGHEVTSKVLSHEGTFGVGYLVATFKPGKLKNDRLILDKAKQVKRAELENKRTKEDEYIRLARLAVESYIKEGIISSVPKNTSPELLDLQAGTFVSLHLNGNLRGCIGTISPTTKTVAEEIIQNGISACSQDPRFNRVTVRELPFLEYSVDVLAEPLKIKDKTELDVKRFGVIVKNGNRRGLLLPDLDGVNSVDEQISIAKQKANIREDEEVELERFEVIRHV